MSGLDGETGKQIERLTREAAQILTVGGQEYATSALWDARKSEPVPTDLAMNTLQGFADFVNGNEDHDYRADRNPFVHVVRPEVVVFYTGIFGEFNQRVKLGRAEAITPVLDLGMFAGPEEFIIKLLANFEPSEDRTKVFECVGNLKTEAVQTQVDDGVTQVATARAGVVRAANLDVPCPVMLTPYRSFSEVEQVTSPFVLRLRGGGEGKEPSCALFECDGGRWRLEAIKRIKAWLAGELREDMSIYG